MHVFLNIILLVTLGIGDSMVPLLFSFLWISCILNFINILLILHILYFVVILLALFLLVKIANLSKQNTKYK